MNQETLNKFEEILSQGIIKTKSIQKSSLLLMKAPVKEFEQLTEILKNQFEQEFSSQEQNSKLLFLFYIFNDILQRLKLGKGTSAHIMDLEKIDRLEFILEDMIEHYEKSEVKNLSLQSSKEILKTLKIWNANQLVQSETLNRYLNKTQDLIKIKQEKQDMQLNFDFQLDDLILVSEHIDALNKWNQQVVMITQKLSDQQNGLTDLEREKLLNHRRHCQQNLNDFKIKFFQSKKDVCQGMQVDIKKILLQIKESEIEIKNCQKFINDNQLQFSGINKGCKSLYVGQIIIKKDTELPEAILVTLHTENTPKNNITLRKVRGIGLICYFQKFPTYQRSYSSSCLTMLVFGQIKQVVKVLKNSAIQLNYRLYIQIFTTRYQKFSTYSILIKLFIFLFYLKVYNATQIITNRKNFCLYQRCKENKLLKFIRRLIMRFKKY